MPSQNDAWGIEIGQDAVKAVHLVNSGGSPSLADYEVLPFKQILTTPDVNVEEAISVALDDLLSRHDLRKSNTVVSVPGNRAFARFAKLPPVDPKQVNKIVEFEAKQQIPFPIEEVEWDYQVFQQEDSPDVEVGIFAITKERVMEFLASFRQVGIRVDELTLSPLALYNAYAFEVAEEPEAPGTVVMDIGTVSTDVIIIESGGIWMRTLAIGGDHFTQALVKAFKLSYPKAEKLKREARTSKYARQIFQAMRPVFSDLVQEVQRSLGYYQSLNRDAELTRLIGFGSTFRLPGLQKFLKQQLQMEVIRPDGFDRVSVDGPRQADFADHALNLGTAYGLALQGLGKDAVRCNILPDGILRQRMWRAKQPLVIAAAAVVAVAAGVSVGRYFAESTAYHTAFAQHEPTFDAAVRQARDEVAALKEVQKDSDPRVKIENLRRVLDYRDLWPSILSDITHALAATNPQPETLDAKFDPTAADALPPDRWQRVFVDQVTAEYLPYGDPATGSGSAQSKMFADKFNADEFWPSGAPTAEQPARSPQILVTIKGSTPNRDDANLLESTVLAWLQNNADREGRPYRIRVPDNPIQQMMRDVVNKPQEANPRITRSNRRADRSRRDLVSGPTQAAPGALEYPERPDWPQGTELSTFELQYAVELLPPDQARSASPAPAPSPSPSPRAGEPAEPGAAAAADSPATPPEAQL